MENTPISNSMRISRRDGAWLIAAVLLHGCLLLIPLTHYSPVAPEPEFLSVSLQTPADPKIQAVEPPITPAPVERPEPEREKVPQPQVAQQPVEQTEPIPLEEETPEPLTAAALVESTRQFNWTVPDKVITRRLGQAPAREVPKNWLPGIELEDNPFDGMMVPVKTEVVDQWVASDGSRNVVLNTPSGETLCGRAQAWDPMRPMVEHLMMFQTCGGGGKRTFKMPDRFLKNK